MHKTLCSLQHNCLLVDLCSQLYKLVLILPSVHLLRVIIPYKFKKTALSINEEGNVTVYKAKTGNMIQLTLW